MNYEVLSNDNRYDRGRSTKAFAVAFIDEERPIDKGNLIEDFAWRRSVNYRPLTKDPELKVLIAGKLQQKPEEITLHFSRKAGCSMCPRSPGLLVRKVGQYWSNRRLEWLRVKVLS